MTDKTGGPAFPLATGWVEDLQNGSPKKLVTVRELGRGMTLRDYFAAHAVTGIVSTVDFEGAEGFDPVVCANTAYSLADAMLVERAKCKT